MIGKKSLFDSDSERKSVSYPDVAPITLSHSELPTSFKVMEETGMIYGLSVIPFVNDQSPKSEVKRNGGIGTKVARCTHCAAYINPFCDISSMRWFCSLCGGRNGFSRKTQKRYCFSDLQLLNETTNTMADFRLPIIESRSNGVGAVSSPVHALYASQRPLVHVFLVQESMRIDAMQAVVEGLCAAVPAMHPDMRAVFITYSNRIGIYSFSSATAVPSIQHVHFMADSASSSSSSSSQPNDSIFEGREMHEIAAQHSVRLMMPLSAVADFHQTTTSIGSCCDSYVSALSALFDAYPAATEFSNNDTMLPKNMLGPVLEVVVDWIVESPASQDAPPSNFLQEELIDGEETDRPVSQGYGSSLQSGIAQIFGKLGLGGGWSGGATGFDRRASPESDSASSDPINMSNRHNAPIDLCSGVILHVFLDSAQDLKVGSHESVALPTQPSQPAEQTSAPVVPLLDADWTRHLAERCASRSLTISLWSVTSYEGDEVGLSAMEPLAGLTGGSLNRTMLGFYPKDERDRLAEMLRRALTGKFATRCLLKLRASPIIDIAESSASGLMLSDDKLPGVYHIASCSPETAYTFEFSYKPNMEISEETSVRNAVCIQLAYSFETLVEGGEEDDDQDLSSEALLAMGLDDSGGEDALALGAYLSNNAVTSGEGHLTAALGVLELGGLVELGGCGNISGGNGMENVRSGSGKSRRNTPRDGGLEDSSRSPAEMRVCPYDRRRRLVTVKYLRIVTVMAECVSRHPRLFAVCHIPTTMSLLVRKALLNNKHQFVAHHLGVPSEHVQSVTGAINKLSINNRGVKLLMNSIIRLLVHFTKCTLELKSNRKHNVSYAEMLAMPNIDSALHELLQTDPLLSELTLRVFSAIDMLETLLHKNRDHDPYSYMADALTEFNHMVCSADWFHLHKVLYPRLIPLNCEDLMLDTQSISLSRSAMLVAHSGVCRYFLLDAGSEIVFYRGLQSIGGRISLSESDTSSTDILARLNSLVLLNKQQNNGAPIAVDDNLSTVTNALQSSGQRSFYLINYLRRRLVCSPVVPRIYLSDAGTQSATYFSAHLLEERSRSGAIELQQFKELLIEVIKTSTG